MNGETFKIGETVRLLNGGAAVVNGFYMTTKGNGYTVRAVESKGRFLAGVLYSEPTSSILPAK